MKVFYQYSCRNDDKNEKHTYEFHELQVDLIKQIKHFSSDLHAILAQLAPEVSVRTELAQLGKKVTQQKGHWDGVIHFPPQQFGQLDLVSEGRPHNQRVHRL